MFLQQDKHGLYEIVKLFHTCKIEGGQYVNTHVFKMKTYIDLIEELWSPIGTKLVFILILDTFPKSYNQL